VFSGLLPFKTPFPPITAVVLLGFKPLYGAYSSGTVRDSHPIPFSSHPYARIRTEIKTKIESFLRREKYFQKLF